MKRAIVLVLTALSLGAAFPAMAACTDPASIEVDWERCNLSGAKLHAARLNDANLSGATWTDGRICAAGSVGTCD